MSIICTSMYAYCPLLLVQVICHIVCVDVRICGIQSFMHKRIWQTFASFGSVSFEAWEDGCDVSVRGPPFFLGGDE